MKNLIRNRIGWASCKSTIGAIAVVGLLAGTMTSQAANYYWNDGTATYNVGANWNDTNGTPGTVPGAADNAINDNGAANVVQINAGDPDWFVNDLQAGNAPGTMGAFEQNGQLVDVAGWLRLGMNTNSVGTYTLNGGTLDVTGGRITVGEYGEGTLTVNGGTVTKTGDAFAIADGRLAQTNEPTRGTVTQTGGVINSDSEFWMGNGDNSHTNSVGTYNLSGTGVLNINSWFVMGRWGAEGTINMTGGAINKGGGGNMIIGDNGKGTVNHSAGPINMTAGELWVGQGGNNGGGDGVYNMSGTASFRVGNWLAIGRENGTGVVNLAESASITKTGGGNITFAGLGTSSGTLNQTGGAVTNITSQTWVGEHGVGTWNMSAGVAMVGYVQLGRESGSAGTLNLTGGTFGLTELTSAANATGTLNLNGATLLARADSPNFMHDLNTADIQSGGVVIDSQQYEVTLAQALSDLTASNGTLTKNGTGTLNLTGANSFNGNTIVNGGKLITSTDSYGAGDFTVADDAGLGVVLTYQYGQLYPNVVTLGTSGTTTLDFDLGNFGNPVAAPLTVFTTLAVNSTVTVNIEALTLSLGQFQLISYGSKTGSGSFVLGDLPTGVVASIVDTGFSIDINVTEVIQPRWNGTPSGDWDIGITANWLNAGDGLPTTYGAGEAVLFNDAAAGTTTVNLVTTVNPASMTVSNATLAYSLVGSGKITGPGSLIKKGTGSLSIANTGGNDYAGATRIQGGTVTVTNLANGGSPSAIGAASAAPANLALAGGTLHYAGPSVAIDRGYSVTPGSVASGIQTDNDLVLDGNMTATLGSAVNKLGAGVLAYTGSGTNTLGRYNVSAGTVLMDGTTDGQVNNTEGEFWVGHTTNAPGHLVMSNATLNVPSWVAVGRGNGSSDFLSTMTLNDSHVNSVNMGIGWDGGLVGNLARQMLTLNGTSTFTNRGDSNLGESGGSTTTMVLNDSSVFFSDGRFHGGWHAGGTADITLSDSSRMAIDAWFSIGHEGGIGTFTMKDDSSMWILWDLNVTDVGTGIGTFNLQDNAVAEANNWFIGKGVGSTGVVNQVGGSAVGLTTGNEIHIGFHGPGTWNMSAGSIVMPNHWFIVGRYSDGPGELNVTGGSIVHGANDAGRLFRVGEEGVGVLNLSAGSIETACNEVTIGWLATGDGTFNLDGGSFQARRIIGGSGVSTFNFNGGTLIAGPNANMNFMTALTTANVLAGGAIIDSGGNNIGIAQALTGTGGLTKEGAGALYLNGAAGYSGSTMVNAGSLGGTGVISGSVTVGAAGALAPGASVGTLTIGGNLTIEGNLEIEVNKALAQPNDVASVTGTLSNTGTGTVTVSNVGTNALVVGDKFTLFNKPLTGGSALSVAGAGVTWANNLEADGSITVTGVASAITFDQPIMSGGNLVLSGSGGTPGGTYVLVSSADLTLPIASWTPVTTNLFDASGNFSITNAVDLGTPTEFFQVQAQ